MHFINLNFLRLRELIKLLYNPIFAIYVWFLKRVGTVATELGISKDEIIDEVQASGAFHLTYNWIKQRKKSDYRPISESVDISTYFDEEYGTTVFSEHFFTTLATSVGLTFLHKSIGTCCDRQDIYVFKKD